MKRDKFGEVREPVKPYRQICAAGEKLFMLDAHGEVWWWCGLVTDTIEPHWMPLETK
jgi:hypothetical protein